MSNLHNFQVVVPQTKHENRQTMETKDTRFCEEMRKGLVFSFGDFEGGWMAICKHKQL